MTEESFIDKEKFHYLLEKKPITGLGAYPDVEEYLQREGFNVRGMAPLMPEDDPLRVTVLELNKSLPEKYFDEIRRNHYDISPITPEKAESLFDQMPPPTNVIDPHEIECLMAAVDGIEYKSPRSKPKK